jgi:hypothetical protein
MMRRRLIGLAMLAFVATTGCGRRPAPEAAPAPVRLWPASLAEAQRAVDSGRYGEADRTLDGFAQRFAGTPEGTEAVFWRALYKLDPSNKEATARDALVVLNAYLAAGPALPRYSEALVLKRSAELMESLSRAAIGPSAPSPTRPATEAPRERAKEEDALKEIQKLREELATTTAELERIKKRLAQQKP